MLAAAGVTELAPSTPGRAWRSCRRATAGAAGAPGPPAPVGQVRDSSAPALAALVHEAGGEPASAGIVPDDRNALAQSCTQSLGV